MGSAGKVNEIVLPVWCQVPNANALLLIEIFETGSTNFPEITIGVGVNVTALVGEIEVI